MRLLNRIDNRVDLLSEATASDIKDINSPEYNRQAAEDLLFNTIGPMTDMPIFSREWRAGGGTPMPEGFTPGGPAPKWSETEIVFAMAGDPRLLGSSATGNPKHPASGKMGGSPIYRQARRVAYKSKRNDLIDDLYSLGLAALTTKMKEGEDERRGGFISWVTAPIKAAMQNGMGSSLSLDMLLGTKGTQFIGPNGEVRRNPPKDAATAKEYRKVELYGIQALENPSTVKGINLNTPAGLRAAADVVKGRFREENSGDKHPDNPFRPLSASYYKTVMQLADAKESGDKEKIRQAMIGIDQLREMAIDSSTSTLGAATGLGQAVTNKDRSRSNNVHSIRVTVDRESLADALDVAIKRGAKLVDKDDDSFIISLAGSLDKANTLITAIQPYGVGQIIRSERTGAVVSADTSEDEEATSLGTTLASKEEKPVVDAEILSGLLNKALTYDPLALVAKAPKFFEKVKDIVNTINQNLGKGEIDPSELKGPLTALQYRYLLRTLGPIVGEYPGKDIPRENTNIPRDDVSHAWWQSGEDPEIEPLDYIGKDGIWESVWRRSGMPKLGLTEIGEEMGKEAEELTELGVKHKKKGAVSKQSVNMQLSKALGKFLMMRAIFASEYGLDESRQYDKIDRVLMREGLNFIIGRLSHTILEYRRQTFKV